MFPSPSDRRAWLPVTMIIVLIFVLGILIGAGPWMSMNLLPVLDNAFRGLTMVFGISAFVHLVVLFPAWFTRRLLNKVTRYQVTS